MTDKPKIEPEKNSSDCKYVHQLKDDARNVPLSESLYKDAKLVCAGDSKTDKELEEKGLLPNFIVERDVLSASLLEQMGRRTDNVKAALSNGEKESLSALETAIVNGDAAALSAKLKEFEANPKEAEKLMGVLTKDLAQAGYDARWSYSTDEDRPGYGQQYDRGLAFGGGYYLTGREDVGHLTITSDGGSETFNSVSFSTHGESAAINTPKSSVNGASSSSSVPMTPADALKEAAQHAAHTA